MTPYLARKKEEKRQRLLDSAHKLFVERGISRTSISQICDLAGVAKGTFYLYFQNKEEILRELNIQLSHDLLQEAYDFVKKDDKDDFVENIINVAHYMVIRFKNDPEMVKMMNRDFHWQITEDIFMNADEPLINAVREQIIAYSKHSGLSTHTLLIRFFSGIAMLFSVCYSCIIDHQPVDIDEAEKEFPAMIRAILTAGADPASLSSSASKHAV